MKTWKTAGEEFLEIDWAGLSNNAAIMYLTVLDVHIVFWGFGLLILYKTSIIQFSYSYKNVFYSGAKPLPFIPIAV